ncbi:MAG TPA: SH3 domain-containing protein [Patescibacteria group bacterium]|nr:SH3 domain-containing protein [Patescibacteria group bacterium]
MKNTVLNEKSNHPVSDDSKIEKTAISNPGNYASRISSKKEGKLASFSGIGFMFICTILAIFLSISGFANSKDIKTLIFQFVFLPVPLYLLITLVKTTASVKKGLNPEVKLGRKNIIIMIFLFMIFFALGVKNIDKVKSQKDHEPEPAKWEKTFSNENNTLVSTESGSVSQKPEREVAGKLKIIAPANLGYVNIRTGPSTGFEIIKKANDGEEYGYVEYKNNWYEIVLDSNIYGFVLDKYIKIL